MRKLIALIWVVMAMGICSLANAEDISIGSMLANAPAVNEGLVYSIPDAEFKPATTVTVYKIDKLSLNAGLTANKETWRLDALTTVMGQVAYTLVEAKDIPIIKGIPRICALKIEPNVWYGIDRVAIDKREGNNESDWGAGLNLISTKW